eukprot:4363241-Prymnesium_polylepis.1
MSRCPRARPCRLRHRSSLPRSTRMTRSSTGGWTTASRASATTASRVLRRRRTAAQTRPTSATRATPSRCAVAR